jgi:type IV secretion system protein VirB4
MAAAQRVPYAAHVSPTVVSTTFGDYVQAFRLAGASFETCDDATLNNWHERLNVLWRNIAGPGVSLWTHVIRRRVRIGDGAPPPPRGFAGRLQSRYLQRICGETLMQNEIYLSVLYRPSAGMAAGLVARALARTEPEGLRQELAEGLDACDKLSQTLTASLVRYEPEVLGCYWNSKAWCSSLLEFLGLLINGEWQRMPLTRSPLNAVLACTRVMFGGETIEYRSATETRVGAMLGIKEYPTPTAVGMYNELLSAPISFVLTQSFAFLGKPASQSLLQRQFNRMANAGDFALSQAAELKEALDALTSNDFVMGDHHFSLQVVAGVGDAGSAGTANRLKNLNDGVALARALLADTGMLVAREDLALEAAYWAQLPGNFPLRPRKSPITSRNFAAMAPFHNYPLGRAHGNHWGDALAVLITSSRSPYYFSLHASDPADPDGGSRKDTGHTLICGPTGSGKTVFIGFLITSLVRQNATQIIFDKDRGLEILVRALGGDYFALGNGRITGFNPLQLPETPANVEFLRAWLRMLCTAHSSGPAHGASVRELADLDQALRGTLALEMPARRLSRLVEFLDPTDPEGVHARLARWCDACRGEYAWVFDSPVDTLASRMSDHSVIGFDVTEFLDNPQTRAPITSYLFHLVRQMLDGRRLVCWMDEFWRLLADPAFEKFAKDGPKTWRKLNAVMCLATQSASDVLESPISRTLVEQTPTKVFFPSAEANRREYIEGLGLTGQEFGLLKHRLEPGSRMFLVKQARHSVVCQLDLKGFDAELAVISGRAAEISRMNDLMSGCGPDPDQWLPTFMSTH